MTVGAIRRRAIQRRRMEDFARSLICPSEGLDYFLRRFQGRPDEDLSVQFRFADHRLDTDKRELCRGSELIGVEPQVFDLLVYLVQNRDRVVSKDDLIATVWGGRIVSESTLTSRINAARRAVGDSGKEQRLIRTVARKGLRFVGAVDETAAATAPGVSETIQPPAVPTASLLLPVKPSIAVLPFTNMSNDPEDEPFADGLSEDLITDLSRNAGLFVIARNSIFAYKGKSVDVRRISEDLGVRYLLEGSARRAAGRVRINVQLIDAMGGESRVGGSFRSDIGGRLRGPGRGDRQDRRGPHRPAGWPNAAQAAGGAWRPQPLCARPRPHRRIAADGARSLSAAQARDRA